MPVLTNLRECRTLRRARLGEGVEDSGIMKSRRTGDERLGMNEPISRRNFVNGTLAAGAGLLLPRGALSPMWAEDDWTGYGGVGDYRSSNGNTLAVMNAAHAIRDGSWERRVASAVDTRETYDLVVVGAGLSGLAAAVLHQKRNV